MSTFNVNKQLTLQIIYKQTAEFLIKCKQTAEFVNECKQTAVIHI